MRVLRMEVEYKGDDDVLQHKQWESREMLENFVAPDYDEAKFISAVLVEGSTDVLSQLTKLINEIKSEIRNQVVCHHSTLMVQTSHIQDIENKLAVAVSRLNNLHKSVHRIRTALVSPYERMQHASTRLTNVSQTTGTLRSCLRVVRLTDKLRLHLSDPRIVGASELASAAQCWAEAQKVSQKLEGIDHIDSLQPFLTSSGELIISLAAKALDTGLNSLNHSQIAGALQVFWRLGRAELGSRVKQALASLQEEVQSQTHSALDAASLISHTASPGSSATNDHKHASSTHSGSGGGSASWRVSLWSRVGALAERWLQVLWKVFTLQCVRFISFIIFFILC